MQQLPHTHLADDQLIDLLIVSEGERVDDRHVAVAGHLLACHECQARHAALVAWMDAQTDTAELEADSVFTIDRLARQRRAIMTRLEGRRAATVIPFPASTAWPPVARNTTRRWISVAAAAGLVFGLVAGRAIGRFDFRPHPSAGPVATATAPPAVQPEMAAPGFEEALLYDVERALALPAVAELHAIDAMTSTAVDASFPQR